MAQNTSLSLGAHFQKFITRLVNKSRYANTSEVMREGLRLLEEREQLRVA